MISVAATPTAPATARENSAFLSGGTRPGDLAGASLRRRWSFLPFWTGLAVVLFLGLLPVASRAGTALEPRAQEMLLASLRVAETTRQERVALLVNPTPAETELVLGVRATSWYALGLMTRDQPGDRTRSLQAFRAVLAQQYDAPDAVWDGTFRRSFRDPTPPKEAKMWHDYDPNWRQFIGTVLAVTLIEYGDRLPPEDRTAMGQAICRAVEGEMKHQRLVPAYTNIAIMHGFLWSYAGRLLNRPEWVRDGEAWVESIYAAFQPNGSFDEYNSPTYYGVDLYGLALLRRHGVTPRLQELGATMEAALWRDFAGFYHAGLRNLAGPYDRAYGMDLRRYASLVGVWLSLVLPEELTPLPPVSAPMEHGGDFLCTPTYVVLGAQIPADVRPHLERFQGERQLTRPIGDGQRVATAWLSPTLMIGAETTGLTRGAYSPTLQFHPATIHWQLPGDEVGWIALRQSGPVDARAEKNRLSIRTSGDATFRLSAGAVAPDQLTLSRWTLPGLTVSIETDARACEVTRQAGGLEITYRDATRFILHPEPL